VFFGHNFWTQNPSKSSKVSKDSDFSLVSNKNLRAILPSRGLKPGWDELGKKGRKLFHLWHHSQKIQNQFFFHCRLEESFEGLNSSLAQSAEELCTCNDVCKRFDSRGKSLTETGCEDVKMCCTYTTAQTPGFAFFPWLKKFFKVISSAKNISTNDCDIENQKCCDQRMKKPIYICTASLPQSTSNSMMFLHLMW